MAVRRGGARARRRLSTLGLRLRLGLALGLCAFASGCAAQSAKDRPFRSPTRDYPPPPAQTSDGEIVGADRMAPTDKLQTGPTNEGLAPGWSLDGGPHYHPADEKHDHDHDRQDDGEHAKDSKQTK